MDLITIIEAVVTSGVVLGVVEWLRYRKKDGAETGLTEAQTDQTTTDNALRYAERLEGRLEKVERKMDEMGRTIDLFRCAVNCSYRCKYVNDPEDQCPVLRQILKSDEADTPQDLEV